MKGGFASGLCAFAFGDGILMSCVILNGYFFPGYFRMTWWKKYYLPEISTHGMLCSVRMSPRGDKTCDSVHVNQHESLF